MNTDTPLVTQFRPNPNYGSRNGVPIDRIIIHDTEGPFQQSIDYLVQNGTSAHYILRSADGFAVQLVAESEAAYHAGNLAYNRRSIGIEHEGYMADAIHWYTPEMLDASARLVADICKRHSISADRTHIIGHSEVPAEPPLTGWGGNDHHTDPGSGWPWDRYIQMIRGYLAPPTPVPAPSPIPSNPSSGVKAAAWVTGWQATDGYPIADPLTETLEDGKLYTVQYFARSRFQLNPDNTVARGLIGSELYTLKYPAHK